MDEAENDVLAHMSFPRAHWGKIHSANPLERLNGEIKRRTNVVGIFPNEAALYRLVGARLLEQNDEWSVQRRYMTLETLANLGENPTSACLRSQADRLPNLAGVNDIPIASYTTCWDRIPSEFGFISGKPADFAVKVGKIQSRSYVKYRHTIHSCGG